MASRNFFHRLARTASRLARGNFTYLTNPLIARIPEKHRRRLFKGERYYCPLCEASLSRFLASGEGPTPANLCPVCFSLTRHRAIVRLLEARTGLLDGLPHRMLHFAPEAHLAARFSRIPNMEYLSADLDSPAAMQHFDITDIPYPEGSFDSILCSHVLEHVPDDRKAMREIRRVLTKGGWALFLVPMSTEPTFEDDSVTDPVERERLFGQSDHVRQYGPDFKDRLEGAGFIVEIIDPVSLKRGAELANPQALSPGELNLCR